MPYLKMFIGNVFVDQDRLLDVASISSAAKDDYYKHVASHIYKRHARDIKRTGIEPKFYVYDLPSKVNDIEISDKEMREFEFLIIDNMRKRA